MGITVYIIEDADGNKIMVGESYQQCVTAAMIAGYNYEGTL